MNEPTAANGKPKNQFSPLRVVIGVLIGVAVLAGFIYPPVPPIPKSHARRLVCLVNLRTLTLGLNTYAGEHGGVYPAAEKWCDLVADRYVPEEGFRCRSGGPGRCHYAVNPLADPNGDPNVVLLFECDGGWNQSGGPELLTMKHHEDKGSCVSFVSGDVRFVERAEIPSLKWGADE